MALPSCRGFPFPPHVIPAQAVTPLDGVLVLDIVGTMHEEKLPAVYIMASRYRGTLYIGVTSALYDRVSNHKNGVFKGFTEKYGVKLLVWYAHHHTMEDAIRREKQLKKWNRAWKFRIIEEMNPGWVDLHESIDPISTLVDIEAGSPPARG